MRIASLAVLSIMVAACAGSEPAPAAPRSGPGGKADGAGDTYGECELQMVTHYLDDWMVTSEVLRDLGVDESIIEALDAYRATDDRFESIRELGLAVPLDDPKLAPIVEAAERRFGWDCGPVSTSATLRVVAANLTSGGHPSYDAGHGARILRALRGDVVLMQELNYGDGSDDALRAFVEETFGEGYAYVREPDVLIPNGIVSRFPIADSGVWKDSFTADRSFVWARIDVPGERDLVAVCVHLSTESADERDAEASALAREHVAAIAAPTDYVVIAGDVNMRDYDEPALDTLSSIAVTGGPYPTDRDGNPYTNASRARPYDRVFASPELHARRAETRVGESVFPYGLVADTRVYDPIEELAPAMSDDSAALDMQHMAVVRDFAIGDDEASR